MLDLMIAEAIRSSAIEGEVLNRDAVMSSISNHLGLNAVLQPVTSRMAEGAGELMVAVRKDFLYRSGCHSSGVRDFIIQRQL